MDAESKASLQATCCGKLGHFVSKHDVCESKCHDCNEAAYHKPHLLCGNINNKLRKKDCPKLRTVLFLFGKTT